MKKTIGVLAHVDAGKTTFSEQILYHANCIRTPGRVDHKNTYLDTSSLEKQRGITIFSDQAEFTYQGNHYFWVDTPGHVDFSSEMERAMYIMDYAVIIISAVEGIQGHTKTVWELLKKRNIPVFFFLNKTDREGANVSEVFTAMQEEFSEYILNFSGELVWESLSPGFLEQLAVVDESLLEYYIANEQDQLKWLSQMVGLIQNRKLFPCFCGSALYDKGIDEFLKALDVLTATYYEKQENEAFRGLIYKIRHDEKNNRVCFLKVLSGSIRAKEEIATQAGLEKINELRRYQANKFETTAQCSYGELCAVTGIVTARPGDYVGAELSHMPISTVPLLQSKVIFDAEIPAKTVLGYFQLLEDEDPLLRVRWEEALKEIHVSVMGTIQLEVLAALVKERFQLTVAFGNCEILYQETIQSTVTGLGHYEPLRHYAEVHLRLAPGQRGGGITFSSACPLDVLDRNYQNLIRTHVFEKEHKGILTGSPLCDVEITLINGRAHLKHTEGGDFREATYRAIRHALEQADNLLLEPTYQFVIEVKQEDVGRVLSDIQKLHGSFDPPQSSGEWTKISGRGPVATFMDYAKDLPAKTRGTGRCQMQFGGYEPCHNAQEVIEKRGYDKDRDVHNTSSSVFCSHGAGFTVKWQEVKDYIHCK